VVRATVFVAVLTLTGLPAASLMCNLFCAEHAATEAPEHCHQSESAEGIQIGHAGHVCDHVTVSEPFVSPTFATLGIPQHMTAHVVPHCGEPQDYSGPVSCSDSPPGAVPNGLSARLTALRI
jgi:hypothetical protein